MKYEVRYYSKSGNTKKVADAIAKAIGVEAQTIDSAIMEPVDILFLGGGIFAGDMNKQLSAYANTLTSNLIKEVVVLTTAAGPKSLIEQFKKILEPKGIIVSNEFFQCRGKFLLAQRGRPNEQDKADAAVFAKKITKQ